MKVSDIPVVYGNHTMNAGLFSLHFFFYTEVGSKKSQFTS